MQLEKSVQPAPRATNVWHVVDLAASRVPEWVFVKPAQAHAIQVNTEHGDMIILQEDAE
jgi:hypothetical protein